MKCKAAVWASTVQARKHCLVAFAEILAGASKQPAGQLLAWWGSPELQSM